jgi:hypothetical protein
LSLGLKSAYRHLEMLMNSAFTKVSDTFISQNAKTEERPFASSMVRLQDSKKPPVRGGGTFYNRLALIRYSEQRPYSIVWFHQCEIHKSPRYCFAHLYTSDPL